MVDFIGEPYGKYALSRQTNMIIMEYNNFLSYVADTLPTEYTDNDDFMAYLNEKNTL